jgi:flavocytochrome c
LVETVYKKVKNIESIKMIFNATVSELLTNEQKTRITGVKYYLNENSNNCITLSAKAVILACGGFGHDFDSEDSLLKEFVPDKMKFPTTNGKQTQGIGVKIARKIGIGLTDMSQVQIHPTGFVNLDDRYQKNKILAPELLRGVGGILINQKGERFCNELGTRDYVSQKIIENCDMAKSDTITQYESFMLINQKAIDTYGGKVNFYINKGYLRKYESLKKFSEVMNISKYYDNLVQTIKEYNESADTKKDKFGKKVFPQKFDLNDYIYAGIITPSIHYCMGGVTMNENGQLIKTDGKIMNGLFGAGEVTGGVHGGNRLGGNSLMECGVFGRRAARAAVEYISTFDN